MASTTILAARAASAGLASSAGEWLIPSLHGTKIIALGMRCATSMVSWAAPDGIHIVTSAETICWGRGELIAQAGVHRVSEAGAEAQRLPWPRRVRSAIARVWARSGGLEIRSPSLPSSALRISRATSTSDDVSQAGLEQPPGRPCPQSRRPLPARSARLRGSPRLRPRQRPHAPSSALRPRGPPSRDHEIGVDDSRDRRDEANF